MYWLTHGTKQQHSKPKLIMEREKQIYLEISLCETLRLVKWLELL